MVEKKIRIKLLSLLLKKIEIQPKVGKKHCLQNLAIPQALSAKNRKTSLESNQRLTAILYLFNVPSQMQHNSIFHIRECEGSKQLAN